MRISLCALYVSVSIVDNALAVDVRVQYTVRMLWKFKKPDPQVPSVSATPAPSTAHAPAGGTVDRVGFTASARVENTDVVARHPVGSFVVPASYRVSGTVVTPRHVVVEGQLDGAALVAPSVHVSSSGRLNVPTQAATITVSGLVEKPVSARELLEVRTGGALRSDVESAVLNIQPGGQISGARLAIGPLRSQE